MSTPPSPNPSVRDALEQIDALYKRATTSVEWRALHTRIDGADGYQILHGDLHAKTEGENRANLHLVAALVNEWPTLRAALSPDKIDPETVPCAWCGADLALRAQSAGRDAASITIDHGSISLRCSPTSIQFFVDRMIAAHDERTVRKCAAVCDSVSGVNVGGDKPRYCQATCDECANAILAFLPPDTTKSE